MSDDLLGQSSAAPLAKPENPQQLSPREQPNSMGIGEAADLLSACGIPETSEDYIIIARHPLCGADPGVNQRLHAAGFTSEQAQLLYDLAAEKLLPLIAEAAQQYEAARQREKLHAHFGSAENYQRTARQLSSWGRGNLPAPAFDALSTTAEGVLAMCRLMQTQEPTLASGAEAPAPADEAALRQMMRDPRYWRTREPEFVRRVTDGFRQLVNS